MIPLIVISTGVRVSRACVESTLRQREVTMTRLFVVEAADQHPPRCALENLWGLVQVQPKETIVVLVEGDDFLCDVHALRTVHDMHARGAWVTYGSFRNLDGSRGFAAPYAADEDVRRAPWRATHLKTFRAGLFQRIALADLQDPRGPDGWLEHARDQAIMLPMLEMAGERAEFCTEALYVYTGSHAVRTDADREDEARAVRLVRSRGPYARVEAL